MFARSDHLNLDCVVLQHEMPLISAVLSHVDYFQDCWFLRFSLHVF